MVSATAKIIVLISAYLIIVLIIALIRKQLLARVTKKRQASNIYIFSSVLQYGAFVGMVIVAIFTFAGSWTGLGVGVGLFTAALGWALQRPITGIAGWLLVVIKRPFEIGDRIIIGGVRGDVAEISLTHIHLRELGGLVAASELNSGRTIMIPNSILFEQNITNYTYKNEEILDQVILSVTFDSDLDKAIEIATKAAKNFAKDVLIRTWFQANGMQIVIRYHAPATNVEEISSNISQELWRQIHKTKNINFSYQHVDVLKRHK